MWRKEGGREGGDIGIEMRRSAVCGCIGWAVPCHEYALVGRTEGVDDGGCGWMDGWMDVVHALMLVLLV